jgi:hypothetical protein
MPIVGYIYHYSAGEPSREYKKQIRRVYQRRCLQETINRINNARTVWTEIKKALESYESRFGNSYYLLVTHRYFWKHNPHTLIAKLFVLLPQTDFIQLLNKYNFLSFHTKHQKHRSTQLWKQLLTFSLHNIFDTKRLLAVIKVVPIPPPIDYTMIFNSKEQHIHCIRLFLESGLLPNKIELHARQLLYGLQKKTTEYIQLAKEYGFTMKPTGSNVLLGFAKDMHYFPLYLTRLGFIEETHSCVIQHVSRHLSQGSNYHPLPFLFRLNDLECDEYGQSDVILFELIKCNVGEDINRWEHLGENLVTWYMRRNERREILGGSKFMVRIIGIFLALGANPCHVSICESRTAFHHACLNFKGDLLMQLLEMLVKYSGDRVVEMLNKVDARNELPITYLKQNRQDAAIEYLRNIENQKRNVFKTNSGLVHQD